MCLFPLHIKRKVNPYLGKLSKTQNIVVNDSSPQYVAFDVPCGKCCQCLQQRKDDFYLRCSNEWDKCNYHALFITLTYNDTHVPLVESVEGSLTWLRDYPPYDVTVEYPTYKLHSVFYKPHVQKFLKSLNEKLIYYIGTEIKGLKRLHTVNGHRCITPEWKAYLKTQQRPIKYLFVCERGKSNIYKTSNGTVRQGTARPHYHGIIFINEPLLYLHTIYILDLIKSLWTYGFSYNLEIDATSNKILRSPSQCIDYVCKYVTKELSNDEPNLLYYDHYHELDCKPFVILSKNFGSDLISPETLEKLVSFGISVPTSSGSFRRINPPLYNVRKLTKYSISGQVSSFNVKRKIHDGMFYDPVNGVPYHLFPEDIDIINKQLSPKPLTHTKVITTNVGKKLNISNKIRKADFYSRSLSLFQKSLNLSYLWTISDSPLSNRNYDDDIKLLNSVSPDDLYLFILNELYLHKDQDESPNNLYHCYKLVHSIISTEKLRIYRKRDIEYKLHLSKSIEAKPELFNLNPL